MSWKSDRNATCLISFGLAVALSFALFSGSFVWGCIGFVIGAVPMLVILSAFEALQEEQLKQVENHADKTTRENDSDNS